MFTIRKIAGPQFIAYLLPIIIMTLSGCSPEKDEKNGLIPVFVSIEPQRYFVERIGGEYLSVDVMVKPGQNPTTYEPTPNQITRLGKSSTFFSIGVPFEHSFLDKVENILPELNIVDTTSGIIKRRMEGHKHEEEDSKEGLLDPHVWMSPILVKEQAAVILKTIINLDPERSEYYRDNYNEFLNDLDIVHSELETTLSDIKGSRMFVYHPSFGYFTDLYGLKQIAIEIEGKEPGPKGLETVIKEIISENIKVMFVQPEFQSSSINVITEATGAAIVPVDPLSYDYLKNLLYIADALAGRVSEGY